MNLADIKTMFDYNYWANRLLLDTCEKISLAQFEAPTTHSFGSVRGTLVHTLDAEWGWRVICTTGSINTEELKETDFSTLAALRERWFEEEQAWRVYLEGLSDADMTSIMRYFIPEGVWRERVLWHCLYHVVNHGMQHRSEAAAILTQYGHSEGGLDFTRYLNELKEKQGK
jgi:uncharacterized damage-inducible protein DinB